jgi:trehalose 6-phosphate phosphatase
MENCLSSLDELDAFLKGGRVLIATGCEGALLPPAVPGAPAIAVARDVAARIVRSSRATLAVLSGRSVSDLRNRVPDGVICSGNYGLEIAGAGFNFVHPQASSFRAAVAELCDAISSVSKEWRGAFVEDHGFSAVINYGKAEPASHHRILLAARRCASRFGQKFSLRSATKALEICPRIAWDKGTALAAIIQRFGPFDSCLCIGDSRSDEAMFRANVSGFNVKVGSDGPTLAQRFLCDRAETTILLEHIAGVLEAGSPEVLSAAAGHPAAATP